MQNKPLNKQKIVNEIQFQKQQRLQQQQENYEKDQNRRNLQNSVVNKYIILPCLDNQLSFTVSDLPQILQDYNNEAGSSFTLHNTYQYSHILSDDDCANKEYNVEIWFLGGNSVNCQFQTLFVESECFTDLKINALDLQNTAGTVVESLDTNLNNLQDLQISGVTNELQVNNFKIVGNVDDLFILFQNISILKIDNLVYNQNHITDNVTIPSVINILEISTQLDLTNCQFNQNTNQMVLKIENTSNLTFTDIQINNNDNSNYNSEVIKIIGLTVGTIRDIYINDNVSLSPICTGINIYTSSDVDVSDSEFQRNRGSPAMCFSQSINVNFDNVLFLENENEQSNGAGLQLQKSDYINVQRSHFEANVSINGAGFYMFQCENIDIRTSEFRRNDVLSIGLGVGGGILGISLTNVTISNSNFIDNQAGSGGGALGLDVSYDIYIQDSEVINNYAYTGGGIYLSQCKNSTVTRILAMYNQAGLWGGAISSLNSVDGIFVDDSLFDSNVANAYGGYAFWGYNAAGVVSTTNCVVNNHTVSTLGGAILDYFSGQSFYENVTFSNNECLLGQAGDIELKLTVSSTHNNVTYTNYTSSSGGSLFLEILTGQMIFNNCTFNSPNNRDSLYIIIISFVTNVEFNNVVINQGDDTNIYLGVMKMVRVQNVTIHESIISNSQQIKGGGLNADRVEYLQISNSQILNSLASQSGGALYARRVNTVQIQNSLFKDCVAQEDGGAMYFNDIQKIQIQNDTIFENNMASNSLKTSKGGGVYINIANNVVSLDTIWQNNKADLHGGGMAIIESSQTEVSNNQFLDNQVYLDEHIDYNQRLQDYILSQGGGLYYGTGSVEMPGLILLKNRFQKNRASSGGGIAIIEEIKSTISLMKVYGNDFIENISDYGAAIRYFGQKKEVLQIQFEFGISQVTGNQQLMGGTELNFDYQYNERRKSENDVQIDLCPKGTQLTEIGSFSCDACNLKGVCDGGYVFTYNKETYWRKNITSDVYYYCDHFPSACISGEVCFEGHKGILCSQCEIQGFYKSAIGQCTSCKDVNMGSFITIICISLIIMGYILYKSVQRIEDNILRINIIKLWNILLNINFTVPTILKIILYHFQIIYLLQTYGTQIPEYIIQTSNLVANPGQVMSNIQNCIFEGMQQQEETLNRQFSYLRVYDYNLGLVFLFLSVYYSLLKIVQSYRGRKVSKLEGVVPFSHRNRHYNKEIIFGGFVVYILNFWPGTMKFALSSLLCQEIDGVLYSLYDPIFRCDDEFYRDVMVPVSVVYLVFYVIIIPLILVVFLLFGIKKKVNGQFKSSTQRMFSFVLLDYKDKYIYWEIVSMVYKILLTLSTVMFGGVRVVEKSIAIIIIMIYVTSLKAFQPIKSNRINQLEIMSNCIIFYFIGIDLLFSNQQDMVDNYEGIKNFLKGTMVFVHICFLVSCFVYLLLEYKSFIVKKVYSFSERTKSEKLKFISKKLQKGQVQNNFILAEWSFLRQAVYNFNKLKQIPNLQKLNGKTLFYNFESEKILRDFLNDDYDALDKSSLLNGTAKQIKLTKEEKENNKKLDKDGKRIVTATQKNKQTQNQDKKPKQNNKFLPMRSIEQRNQIKERFKKAELRQVNKPSFRHIITNISMVQDQNGMLNSSQEGQENQGLMSDERQIVKNDYNNSHGNFVDIEDNIKTPSNIIQLNSNCYEENNDTNEQDDQNNNEDTNDNNKEEKQDKKDLVIDNNKDKSE